MIQMSGFPLACEENTIRPSGANSGALARAVPVVSWRALPASESATSQTFESVRYCAVASNVLSAVRLTPW
jgi:hypothetical protein